MSPHYPEPWRSDDEARPTESSLLRDLPSPPNRPWIYRFTAALFLAGQVVTRMFQGTIHRRHIMDQLIIVGPGTLVPVLITAYFSGMIFVIQTARELQQFGAVESVGGAFALAFCRELAPILTASVLAGQVGSAFAAELGSMQVTEQIDALKMLRTHPIDYLVVPRVIACCLMLPILTTFALVTGITGGAFIGFVFYRVTPGVFLASVQLFLGTTDLLNVVLKGFIFGAVIAVISCSWGLTTTGGVRGVGRSATGAVVTSWVSIFVVDFFLSWMLFQELGVAV